MKKTLLFLLLHTVSLSGYAVANTHPESTGNSLAVILFLGFIGLIIVGQLIPGVMLFFSMIKGLFRKHPSEIKHADHK
ncbi:MAG: hypothetical protein A2X84_07330 [Desulfuromonadaceae bacterium GWC2_58_13]|nr:MAG: hypothetical protein A2X84_07330 [Desulfuromonadaceae bacterium GWC2_58_13]